MTPVPPLPPVFEQCCGCGLEDETVILAPDPFPYSQREFGTTAMLPFCTLCYRDRCEDV